MIYMVTYRKRYIGRSSKLLAIGLAHWLSLGFVKKLSRTRGN